jgi:O-antigen ligase
VFIFLWTFSKKKIASLLAIALVGVFVLIYASDAYFNRMSTIAHYETEGSAAGRIKAWKGATRMAIDHPLTGVGAGQFPAMYGRHYREEGSGRWLNAHSMYFLVLGELGLPGIVVLLALVWGSPLALLSLRRRVLAATHGPPPEWRLEAERFLCMLAAGCIGFAVAGAFLSVAYYPHLFVLTAVTASARLIVKKRLENSQPAAPECDSAQAQTARRLLSRRARRRAV